MDYYSWLKAAHIVAVIVFVSGMVLNGFLLGKLEPGSPQSDRAIAAARRWNDVVIGPALLLVWVLGLLLAYLGTWYADIWMLAKFALVFVLSGLHGAQSAQFRRLQQSPDQTVSSLFRNSAVATIVFVILIVLLVVLKPFV